MAIGGGDGKETERQLKYEERKDKESKVEVRYKRKREKEISDIHQQFEIQDESMEMFQHKSIEMEEVSLIPITSHPENIVIKKPHETMMQIAAQWLEYRSPVSNVDDEDNSLMEFPDPQLPGEEVLLLTPDLITHHLATMNPIPLPSEDISLPLKLMLWLLVFSWT